MASTDSSLAIKGMLILETELDHCSLCLAGVAFSSYCLFKNLFQENSAKENELTVSSASSLLDLLESLFQESSKCPIHAAYIYKTYSSSPIFFSAFHGAIYTMQKQALIHKSSIKHRHKLKESMHILQKIY